MIEWIALATSAWAAEPSLVDGTVRAFGSGVPVAGARVRAGAEIVETDAQGRFRLAVPGGVVEVTVEADDFEPEVSSIFVDGEPVRPTWYLRPLQRPTLVVVGHRSTPSERRVLPMEELKRTPGSLGDPVRALQSLPSVGRGNDLAGDIIVRGAEGTNTATFLDGMRVPYLTHFLLGRSVVDPGLVDDIAFYPGGAPLRYGNVSQAVVDARIDDDPADAGVHGHVRADLIDGGVSATTQLGRQSTLWVAGRAAWAGALATAGIAAVGAGDSGPELTMPYVDGTLRWVWRRGPSQLTTTFVGVGDGLRFVPATTSEQSEDRAIEEAGYDPYQLYTAGFWRLGTRWTHDRGRSHAALWAYGGTDLVDNRIPGLSVLANVGVQNARLRQVMAVAGAEASVGLGRVATWDVGAEGMWLPARFGSYDGVTRANPLALERTEPANAGAWTSIDLAGPTTHVEPGMRASVHRPQDDWVVLPEPRLAVSQELSHDVSLFAFAGRTSQAPSPAELALGWAGDGVTRATQVSGGGRARLASGAEVDVTLYHTWMQGLSVRGTTYDIVAQPRDWDVAVDPQFQLPGLLHTNPSVRAANGRAFGGELYVRAQPGSHAITTSLAVGRSFRKVGDGERFVARSDIPVAVTAAHGMQLPRGWSFGWRLQIASGLPYAAQDAVQRSTYLPLGFVDRAYWPYAGIGNGRWARFPTYVRADLRVERAWTTRRAQWTTYLDVFNATNRRNPLWATFDWTEVDLLTRAYLPLLPTLGIDVEY